MGAAEETADFAALLRELKQRSGLSYEALAKRAHMSTSTLHRYCKGEGVPADNAVVARFARVCKATPEELVELHRRWALADAARERARRAAADTEPASADRAEAPTSDAASEPRSVQARTDQHQPDAVPASPTPPAPAPQTASATAPSSMSAPADPPGSVGDSSPDSDILTHRTPTPVRSARKRWALIAASTAAVVAVSTAITVNLKGGGTEVAGNGRPAGAVSSSGPQPSASSTTPPSASASPSARPSRSPSPKAAGAKPSASAQSTDTGPQGSAGVPLTVTTRTYAWDDPQCEGKYLINRPPGEVSPPVMGQDVPGWVKAHSAVAADRQRVALTVQGAGDETVVIESMHVRVVSSSAPPAWNAYLGSSGCGGGVETRSFDTDLDAGHPAIVPKAGQRGFPYKVSQSDPEVLYITAQASAHDVSWYVELQWSSGGRQGTIRIDDHGKPFRTSGSGGRPLYEYPVGGTEWVGVAED
ncbi:helix-turn-helix domain-containing protein [Streptomyces sp. NPDC059862]|uniref:helix-turn-helix domain-containing protein n=1 Tax=unclassified Streptomyces TaxID=2593676 RepID=UPI003624BAF6